MKDWLRKPVYRGLIVSGLMLSTGPCLAFWFCPTPSNAQSDKAYTSPAPLEYPRALREFAPTNYPYVQLTGVNNGELPPYDSSSEGGPMPLATNPFIPYAPYPMGQMHDIRLRKWSDANNYYLTIYLSGYEPADIGVAVNYGQLMIYNTTSEQRRQQAEGYYQQMTSFRRFSRRMSLPRDANPAAMTRTNGEATVEVVIPRMR